MSNNSSFLLFISEIRTEQLETSLNQKQKGFNNKIKIGKKNLILFLITFEFVNLVKVFYGS